MKESKCIDRDSEVREKSGISASDNSMKTDGKDGNEAANVQLSTGLRCGTTKRGGW